MTKTYTPLIIEGKIFVVVDIPEPPRYEKGFHIEWHKERAEQLAACTKYETLPEHAPYWKERIGQRVEVEIKEVSCHANRDGECCHKDCPQLRDNEPHATGRCCPLDNWDYDEDPKMYAVIPGTHDPEYKTAIPPQQKQGDEWDEAGVKYLNEAGVTVLPPQAYKLFFWFKSRYNLTKK